MGCVYQAQNKINGLCYIGKTTLSLSRRASNHVAQAQKGSSTFFHRSLRKYGADGFEWSILYTSNDDCELKKTESEFIALLNTRRPNGYNLTNGGDGSSGYRHSPESRAKISKNRTGKRMTLEQRQACSMRYTGRKHSEQSKHKISQSHRGKTMVFSDETTWRNNMSRSRQQWWANATPEQREARTAGMHSEEGRRRRRLAQPHSTFSDLARTNNSIYLHNRWHVKRGIVSASCVLCAIPQIKESSMNRRSFLQFFGTAAAGAAVAYSFPSVIVPQNIVVADPLELPGQTMTTCNVNRSIQEKIFEVFKQYARYENFYALNGGGQAEARVEAQRLIRSQQWARL